MPGYLSVQCSNLIPCLSFSFPLSSSLHHPSPKLPPSYGNWETFDVSVGNESPSPHRQHSRRFIQSFKEVLPPFSMTFHNKQINREFYGHITGTSHSLSFPSLHCTMRYPAIRIWITDTIWLPQWLCKCMCLLVPPAKMSSRNLRG